MRRQTTKKRKRTKSTTPSPARAKLPIDYWSHSSLVAYLRNPLAWYKRYALKIYDTPRSPAGIVGTAAHKALEQFYLGAPKAVAIETGLANLRSVQDFEINFGAAKTKAAKKAKRESMEREYAQAIEFYLARPPRHEVLGVEVRGFTRVPGHRIPIKAISDLVVRSRGNPGMVDIVDHKFVDSFSKEKGDKALFWLQAVFNYYTVTASFGKPVKRFIVIECKKRRNKDGRGQLRRYAIDFEKEAEAFAVFHKLLRDATDDMRTRRRYLPNPSDLFEGQDSFDAYRLGLFDSDPEE